MEKEKLDRINEIDNYIMKSKRMLVNINSKMKLSEINAGNTFTVADIEFIKVKNTESGCIVVAKESLFNSEYGDNNNFAESKILKELNKEILPKIEDAIGAENVRANLFKRSTTAWANLWNINIRSIIVSGTKYFGNDIITATQKY